MNTTVSQRLLITIIICASLLFSLVSYFTLRGDRSELLRRALYCHSNASSISACIPIKSQPHTSGEYSTQAFEAYFAAKYHSSHILPEPLEVVSIYEEWVNHAILEEQNLAWYRSDAEIGYGPLICPWSVCGINDEQIPNSLQHGIVKGNSEYLYALWTRATEPRNLGLIQNEWTETQYVWFVTESQLVSLINERLYISDAKAELFSLSLDQLAQLKYDIIVNGAMSTKRYHCSLRWNCTWDILDVEQVQLEADEAHFQ